TWLMAMHAREARPRTPAGRAAAHRIGVQRAQRGPLPHGPHTDHRSSDRLWSPVSVDLVTGDQRAESTFVIESIDQLTSWRPCNLSEASPDEADLRVRSIAS